jgi:cation diffusion facilitator family transporter
MHIEPLEIETLEIETLEQWQHSHDFGDDRSRAEAKTKIVMVFTAAMMVAEITAGSLFGSMALLADGWHMATHVAAFGITIFVYQYARKHATNPRYTFGTGKVSVLGGFASAVALAVIAFLMAFESIGRFLQPQAIQFNEAIGVAFLGLLINLVSAWLLEDQGHDHHGHHPDHQESHEKSGHTHDDNHVQAHDHHQSHAQESHNHQHERHHHGQDHNLRAAYFHVLADALTSVFAIVALFAGKFLGWVWMDALMGIVGAAVITKWAYGLVTDTSAILLDGSVDKTIKLDIVTTLEAEANHRITDLHIWYINQNHLAATIALVTSSPRSPEYYKGLLKRVPSLSSISHVLIEVNPIAPITLNGSQQIV